MILSQGFLEKWLEKHENLSHFQLLKSSEIKSSFRNRKPYISDLMYWKTTWKF